MPFVRSREMLAKYKDTLQLLTEYEAGVYDSWHSTITGQVEDSLMKPLLIREEEGEILRVNFSLELMSLLREVRI